MVVPSPTACVACGGAHGSIHDVREMMFGVGERFRYGECSRCGSLHLLDVPSDLAPYYPPGYYSFTPRSEPAVARVVKRLRDGVALRGRDGLARLMGLGARPPGWITWVRIAGLDRTSRICDIGCGSGEILMQMRAQGFENLMGFDAYIAGSTVVADIPIRKAYPHQVEGTYDMVMLNHAFEHMADPERLLMSLHRLLHDGSVLMLRLPVAGSHAWRTYGTSWVALDAPRHLHLFTVKGLRQLAERCGFRMESVVFDSTALQFWGSEQYLRGVPLMAENSYAVSPASSSFDRGQIRRWERESRRLNAIGDGDAAAFFLSPMRQSPATAAGPAIQEVG